MHLWRLMIAIRKVSAIQKCISSNVQITHRTSNHRSTELLQCEGIKQKKYTSMSAIQQCYFTWYNQKIHTCHGCSKEDTFWLPLHTKSLLEKHHPHSNNRMPFLPWSILSLGSDCSTSTEAKIIYWVCVSLSLPLCINWALLSGTWQLASLHQRVKDVSSPLHKLIIPHFILINPMVMLGASPAPSIELEPESGGIAADEGRAGGLMKPKCGGNVRGLIRIHCLCRKAIFAVYTQ